MQNDVEKSLNKAANQRKDPGNFNKDLNSKLDLINKANMKLNNLQKPNTVRHVTQKTNKDDKATALPHLNSKNGGL